MSGERDDSYGPNEERPSPNGHELVGAAQNLASVVCCRGYRAAVSMPEVADRIITVSRNRQ